MSAAAPATHDHKLFAKYLMDRVWNHADHRVVAEHFASDFVCHIPGRPDLTSGADYARLAADTLVAMPDLGERYLQVVGEGDEVLLRTELTGTHRGFLDGIPPTGLPTLLTRMTWLRFSDGRLAELWQQADHLSLFTQLGLVPPEGAGPLGQIGHSLRTTVRLGGLAMKAKLARRDAA